MNTIKKRFNSINIWVSVLFGISFFVFEPMKNYLSNIDDYWFDFSDFSVLISVAAFAVVLTLLVFLALIPVKLSKILSALLFFLTVAFYIQGNFIPNTNGALDGHKIDWTKVNIDMIASYLLWGSVIIAFFVILLKRKLDVVFKIIKPVSPLMIILEIITIVSLMIMNPRFSNKSEYLYISDEQEFNISKNQNFIMIVLDTFDATYFNGGLTEDIKIGLEDFTYYPDSVSTCGHTLGSVAQMLTGETYTNQSEFYDYLTKSFEKSPLINDLIDNKWNVGLYADYEFPNVELLKKTVNLKDYDCYIASKRKFYQNVYRIVGYNIMPYPLKRIFWFYPNLNDLKSQPPDEQYNLYEFDNQILYDGLDNIQAIYDEPAFRFYHVTGMHTPYMTNADVVDIDKEVSFEETREANYKIILKAIKKIKETGVYDNSVIIIMSDHGGMDRLYGHKQNPMLMIKGINEHHKFMESNIPISYTYLEDAYNNLLDKKIGEDVFDFVNIDNPKERLFYDYGFDSMNKMTEYSVIGKAWEADLMKETGRDFILNNSEEK